MSIQLKCSVCGRRYALDEKLAGKQVRCKCEATLIVPSPDPIGGDHDPISARPVTPPKPADPFGVGESPKGPALPCPKCKVALKPGAIFCVKCGYHQRLGRTLETDTGKLAKAGSQLPKDLTIEETDQSLRITQEWPRGRAILFLILGVVFLPACFMGIPLLYCALCYFKNNTVIELTRDWLSISHGPIFWPTNKSIDGSDLRQLYVVTRRYHRINTDDVVIGTLKGEHPLVHEIDHLYAVRSNGWRCLLLWGVTAEVGVYVERKIERFLQIQNAPVISTWYQRFLRWESTAYDNTAHAKSPTAITAKSFPLPPWMLILLAAPILFFGMVALSVAMLFSSVPSTAGPPQPKLSDLAEQHVLDQLDKPGVKHLIDRINGKYHLVGIDLPRSATNEDLEIAASLPHLRVLKLEYSQITSAGLKHIEDRTTLQELYLRGTKVEDDGLIHLEKLENLEILTLAVTKVSDDGLVHLADLKKLSDVDLMYTQVTPEGAAELRQKLPGCEIKSFTHPPRK